LVEKNISAPRKTVKAVLELSSNASDGVEVIRKALLEGKKVGGKDTEIFYSGGGNYVLKVTSHDYKSAEKQLSEVSEKVLASVRAAGGVGNLRKES
jgi:translation initiation factor 2 subunit 1